MNLVEKIIEIVPHNIRDILIDQIDVKIVGPRIHRLMIETYDVVFGVLMDSERRADLNVVGKLIETCDLLTDFSWERINTGYWKDVDVCWRYCFGHSSLLTVILLSLSIQHADDPQVLLKKMLRTLDVGLLMSPELEGKVLNKLATVIHQHLLPAFPTHIDNHDIKRMKTSHVSIEADHQIISIRSIDVLEFQEKYLKQDVPVVIKDAIYFWPSIDATSGRTWSVPYLKSIAGHRTVPIEIGSRYTDNNWSQKLMTINEFVDQFIENNDDPMKVAYLAQHELFTQISELRADFSVPDVCSSSRNCDNDEDTFPVRVNAWFGPRGTVSPLHTDPKDNILVQVFGSKYIRLYHRDIPSDVIYCHDSKLLNNTSQVDVEHVDEVKFPNFQKYASGYMSETILNTGEMLFIPKGFWHFVKSTSTSFSISFWWS